MAYVFDMDAISEVLRPRPAPAYLRWLSRVPRAEQFTSVVVIGELYKGAFGSSNRDRHLDKRLGIESTHQSMPTRISNFVGSHSPATPSLPPMHSTTADLGRTILEGPTPTLSSTSCPVFKEPLLYLFYGRPAYRVADEQKDRNDGFYSPVCFILAPDALLSIKRIFPFDTGGYDRYKSYFPPGTTLGEFALATTSDAPRRHVTAFFNTNGKYYLGTAKPSLSVPGTEVEVQGYYNLITAPGAHDFDGRCSTVELQVDHDISLSDKTLAVILPEALANIPELREAVVKRLNAELITYPEFAHFRPSCWHGHVLVLARDFLSRAGLL